MKAVAFNGSPRKDGNTASMVKLVLKELEKEKIRTELVQIGGTLIRGCIACNQCHSARDKSCAQKDDKLNEYIKKMLEADAIIIGSPTYFANVSAETKALIDRAGMTAKANDDMFRRKIGAAVVAVRRGGAIHVFNSINHFFLINQMIVPGSCYWNMAYGLEPGDAMGDEEGVETMKVLGKNIAWVMKKTSDQSDDSLNREK